MPPPTLRQKLGCWLHERWKAELVLRFPSLAKRNRMTWLDLCNRNEQLRIGTLSERECLWEDSSKLTVSGVFPAVGNQLWKKCFQQWPVDLQQTTVKKKQDAPLASILIAMGGRERLPLLKAVLRSLLSQTVPNCEIIVSELGETPLLASDLPKSVRYVFSSKERETPFNKSFALNRAAELARGEVFFIHDGDYLVPKDYVRESLRLLDQADGLRPCRFIFYANDATTKSILKNNHLPKEGAIESIVQNNPTPLVITASAYENIGGHDEDYFGWGGEDTEFMSRLRTLNVREGGTLPVIHLWHPAAPKKASGDRNASLHEEKMQRSPEQRIEALKKANFSLDS